VIVLSLTTALVEAQAVVEALRTHIASMPPPASPADDGGDGGDGDGGGGGGGAGKTVIALSSVLTWDRTTSMPQPWDEAQYKRRRPGMKGADVRDAEAAVMTLSRPERGVRCHVVAAGMPYGAGFGPLYPLLRRAWLCSDNPAITSSGTGAGAVKVGLPVPCIRHEAGKNPIPAIHVNDLAAFVARVATASVELQPEAGSGEYFVAVDEGADTLVDVVAAVSKALGVGGTRLLTKEAGVAFMENPDSPQFGPGAPGGGAGGGGAAGSTAVSSGDDGARAGAAHLGVDSTLIASAQVHLSASAAFDGGTLAIFNDGRVSLPDWHSRGGVVAGIDAVATEFKAAHDLRPVRLVVAGPPASNKSATASLLGAKYAIPVVSLKSAVAAIRTGNLRALSDGTPERLAALKALREAVDKVFVEFDGAAAAAAAAAEKAGAKGGKKEVPGTSGAKKATGGKDAAGAGAGATGGDTVLDAAALERGPRLPRDLAVRVLRASLLAPECRNRGYVLDGFPRTLAEAKALFTALPEGDDGITPPDGDAGESTLATAGKEEADEDAAAVAEAVRRGITITVLGTVVAGATTKKPGANGGKDDGDDGDGDDAPAGDDGEALAKVDLEAQLLPTSVITLEGSDTWCEARHMSETEAATTATGHFSRDTFLRRLKRFRLHHHTSLLANPLSWLEANARLESCVINLEAVGAAVSDVPPAAASGSGGGDDDDDPTTRVPPAVVRATLSASSDVHDLDAHIAVSAASSAASLSTALTLPSDLSDDPAAHSNALSHLYVLKRVAPFVHKGGRPGNFHPNAAEVAAVATATSARAAKLGAAAAAAESQLAAEEAAARVNSAAAVSDRMATIAAAEAALLDKRTAPLRQYLLAQVIPHITAGLIEVCKAGPTDPIDHLAGLLLAAAAREEAAAGPGGKE